MKKRILTCLLAVVMAVSAAPIGGYVFAETPNAAHTRTLTFEDADYKGGTNFSSGNNWSSLIDNTQYGGSLLYGTGSGYDSQNSAYQWTDENNTKLHSVLSEGYGLWCFWSGGHAISHYVTGEYSSYGDYNNQLTVYKNGVTGMATTGGGHNGSNNFAVHYGYSDNSGYSLGEDALPKLSFSDGKARVIESMYINNTTYALNTYVSGNNLSPKIGANDWVKIIATGYGENGKNGKTAEFFLCNGPQNIVTDWTQWDLSGLGAVTKVTFNITGSSDNGAGFSQPAYFVYDDVMVQTLPYETVEDAISDIGDVTIEKEEAIHQARELYEALEASDKSLVSNLSVLEAAETALDKMITLTLSSIQPAVEKGDTFDVVIQANKDINGLDIDLQYDNTKAELEKVALAKELDEETEGQLVYNDVQDGENSHLLLTVQSVDPLEEGENQELLTISFKATDYGTMPFGLQANTVFKSDDEYNPIEMNPTVSNQISEGILSYLLGDVNQDGKVSIVDAYMIQVHVVGKKTLNNQLLLVANANRDEKVSIADAYWIQKFVVGLIDQL